MSTTPMFAPDGTLGDIPNERVSDATKSGFKVGQELVSPKGEVGVVPMDRAVEAMRSGFMPRTMAMPGAPPNRGGKPVSMQEEPLSTAEKIASGQHIPVPIPGNMTPEQDNAAAMRSIHGAAQVGKGMAQSMYDILPPGLFKSYMQQKHPNVNIPLPQSAPLKDFPQNAAQFGLMMAAGAPEGDVEGAVRSSARPQAVSSPTSTGPSVGSILARHIPGVGKYLRTIDDIQSLLGKDAPHPTSATNVATPRPTPVPETNGIPWGSGGQGPVDLRGKMIPPSGPTPEVQNIPLPTMKPTAAATVDPYRTQLLPKMQPGTSTTIEAHGYNPNTQEAVVHFKNGGVYKYKGVPQQVYNQFQNSESQGSFHANNLKGRYVTEKIGQVKPNRFSPGGKQ